MLVALKKKKIEQSQNIKYIAPCAYFNWENGFYMAENLSRITQHVPCVAIWVL